MAYLSVYQEGLREAERHKWIESEKHGWDVGTVALGQWYDRYWPHYCRGKCLEHLTGRQHWREFGDDDFGLIPRLLVENDLLLDRILDRVLRGYENLDVIYWALEWGLPIDPVMSILHQLNINRARLEPVPARI